MMQKATKKETYILLQNVLIDVCCDLPKKQEQPNNMNDMAAKDLRFSKDMDNIFSVDQNEPNKLFWQHLTIFIHETFIDNRQ